MKHLGAAVACLSLGCVSLAGAQTSPLMPADISPFDVGAASGQVLLADLNKDGHLDLLTRHQTVRAVRAHLGDGRGRFETAKTEVTLRSLPAT